MCNFRIDISGKIGLSDYSTIFDYIEIVNSSDNLIIYMQSMGNDDVEVIHSILKDNNFNVNSQGYDNNEIYYIIAKKIV